MKLRLYTDLAAWFPLLTPPAEYAAEVGDVHDAFTAALGRLPKTLLELGCGGGHLASHLDPSIELTLTDIAPAMIEQSRRLNPRADHVVGDMRKLRLGRRFEAVLVHDAIMYMTTEDDLRAALSTARAHTADGGACFIMPDCVAETYKPSTDCGGDDGDGRSLRYLEWSHPIPPGETRGEVDYIIVLKHEGGRTEVVHDRHEWGVFPRETWKALLREVGFNEVTIRPDSFGRENFLAR